MKKLFIGLIVTIMLVGCATTNSNKATRTIEFKGQKITLPEDVKRIVTYDMVSLDVLDSLDVDVIGVSKNIVPDYLSKYQDEKYEDIGLAGEPDYEKLSALNPDLIIISNRTKAFEEQLKEIAPVLNVTFDTAVGFDSFKENVRVLGEIVHLENEIESKIQEMEQKMEAFKKEVNQDLRTLTLLTTEGKISAFGLKTRFLLIHDILGIPLADGGIESSTHGQVVNYEYIARVNPDVIYVLDRDAVVNASQTIDVLDNPLVKQTNAYKEGRVIALNPGAWYLTGLAFQSFDIMIKDLKSSFK